LKVKFLNIDDIIKGCLDGNIKHQELLYTLHKSKMMGICLRYSNNREEAQDILHDGFMDVFSSIRQYRGDGPFLAWMTKIFIYKCIRANKQWEMRKSDHGMDSLENTQYDEKADIISTMSAKEIMKLVQDLSPGYRTVFNLYVVEGYSHKEIADLLDISENTSKSQLSRAKTILQQKIIQQRQVV
jgi:RNA polymerase sigma factor (sigma-70 family)